MAMPTTPPPQQGQGNGQQQGQGGQQGSDDHSTLEELRRQSAALSEQIDQHIAQHLGRGSR
ncbi:hypothetical protein ABZ554_37965 [Streptomyces sp. NPDC020125]|uniref:hypothetical protein n=1 Tax=unclassified Streptomyces TaxID=2593676 RepID=UPI0033FF0A2E